MPADKIIETDDELPQRQRDILEALDLSVFREHGASAIDLMNNTEIPKATIHRYLSKLKDKGLIRQHKSGDPYYVTDKGKALIKEE
jgi:DNA-binding IclR family transcriptional regulator